MRLAWIGLIAVTAACGAPDQTPSSLGIDADSADQVMAGMEFSITESGVLVSQVAADTARVFNRRQEMELRTLTMVFFDSTGRERSRITADSGLYQIRTQMLDARGNVVVVTPPPDAQTLRTTHLVYDKVRNLIDVDTAYTWESVDGRGSGSAFTSTTDFSRLRQFEPRAVQTGEGILLPETGPGVP